MRKIEPGHDRNFDDLAHRFQEKVYGGLKGRIRLAVLEKDFQEFVPKALMPDHPMNILDAGGGTGAFSLGLARQGHCITLCDLSRKMLDKAMENFSQQGLGHLFLPVHGPIQDLGNQGKGPFDLVLCHAVLEWVKDPRGLIKSLMALTDSRGILSLVFYNLNGMVFKNLLRTNYKKILEKDYPGYPGSLTPTWPRDPQDVLAWLSAHPLDILCHSGIRVFHDYILDPRDRERRPEAVVDLELQFSRQTPYRDLGRFIHILGRKRG